MRGHCAHCNKDFAVTETPGSKLAAGIAAGLAMQKLSGNPLIAGIFGVLAGAAFGPTIDKLTATCPLCGLALQLIEESLNPV